MAPFVHQSPLMQRTNKKVLIVDRNDAFRSSLGTFLKGLGHDVFEGVTGQEAIDKAGSIRPDLIMMEVQLPGLNGDDVTVRLKSNRSTRNIPVVINTGWTTACNIEERVERARVAGAAEVLYKPLQFPMLRNILRSYLMV
ncbi:MAG TPA: response regulator [Candidatus Limnocylindrales bacterium]|nr:response regulator [Candidatus Limnocylindrales bacterium]